MALVETIRPPELAPAARRVLGRLRGQIRLYVWLEGLAAGAIWLGLVFWASLAIDWFFEPVQVVRWMMLAGAAAVFGLILVREIGFRVFVHFHDRNLAMLLERRFPVLDESLLTAVELAGAGIEGQWTLPMLNHTAQEAAERMAEVHPRAVFRWGRLGGRLGTVMAFGGAIAAFAVFAPDAFGTWARRSLLGSRELWPRHVRLSVEVVQDGVTRPFEDGAVKVARGSDVEIVAQATAEAPWEVPAACQVRYRAQDGRHRHTMSSIGREDPHAREYSYTLRNLVAPIRFEVAGGDAARPEYRIDVVESPMIRVEIGCEYPKYTGRPSTRLAAGSAELLQGSKVTVYAEANKDLEQAKIDQSVDDRFLPPAAAALDPDRRHFTFAIDRLDRDTTLAFSLLDSDGIRTHEPVRVSLAAVRDEPPRLNIQLQGIGTAITPQARLPLAGDVTDDYGLARVWFDYGVEKLAGTLPIATLAPGTTDYKLKHTADLKPLGLQPGKKLLATVKAADFYDLGKEPNVGSSERWVLDVVTPEQLRTMLEARELVLRQRTEAIVQEMSDTRDALVRVDFGAPPKKPDSAKTSSKQATEPDDEAEGAEMTPERFRALQAMRVERALQDARKNAHETLGVAESFEDIRQQLVNNCIDTEELIRRIQGGIADPLRATAEHSFPELEHRLETLQAVLADVKLGPPRRDAARGQVDQILTELHKVLDRMLELESFNEAVELLRTIVQMQEKLNVETQQRQKQQLRELKE